MSKGQLMGFVPLSCLARCVIDFLQPKLQKNARLLLGFSGGTDSLALFYLLLEACQRLNFTLHLAHIDHGWRKESRAEAEALGTLAASWDLPFHCHRLEEVPVCDRENWARQERQSVFQKLVTQHRCQALLLAHHADDQAETVLKRISEGAGLRGLGGLAPVKTIGSLLIYRPLLNVRKSDLAAYLKNLGHTPFVDPTNRDPAYLRARMRMQIFPAFERAFGKRVALQFTAFGALWREMQQYLDKRSRALRERFVTGPFGACLCVSLDEDPLELKWVLLDYAAKKRAHFSRAACAQLIELLLRRAAQATMQAPPLSFVVSGQHLFILHQPKLSFFTQQHRWRFVKTAQTRGWEAFWLGEVSYFCDYDKLISLSQVPSKMRKKICERYRAAGVPPILRAQAPLFVKDSVIVGECLTRRFYI